MLAWDWSQESIRYVEWKYWVSGGVICRFVIKDLITRSIKVESVYIFYISSYELATVFYQIFIKSYVQLQLSSLTKNQVISLQLIRLIVGHKSSLSTLHRLAVLFISLTI